MCQLSNINKGKPLSKEESGAKHHDKKREMAQKRTKEPAERKTVLNQKKQILSQIRARGAYSIRARVNARAHAVCASRPKIRHEHQGGKNIAKKFKKLIETIDKKNSMR